MFCGALVPSLRRREVEGSMLSKLKRRFVFLGVMLC